MENPHCVKTLPAAAENQKTIHCGLANKNLSKQINEDYNFP
jgi:hypothetical protein